MSVPQKIIFPKVTSGQIIEGKECATNAFLWEKFIAICFHV
jgi:hypothetical protein